MEQNSTFQHIQTVFLKNANLFHKHELSLSALNQTIRYYLIELYKIALNPFQFLSLLRQSLGEIFRISFSQGILTICLIFCLLLVQIMLSIFRPVIPILYKTILYIRIKKALLLIKPSREGVRILCLLPNLSFGGAEKVLWDIVSGLKSKGYHFYFLSRRRENNAWCENFLKSFSGAIFLPDRGNQDPKKEEETYQFLRNTICYLNIDLLFISDAPGVFFKSIPKIKSEFLNLKIVDLLHAEDFGGLQTQHLWLTSYLDWRVCISDSLKKILISTYAANKVDPYFSSKTSAIHNGLDLDFLNPSNSTQKKFYKDHNLNDSLKVISFIGRLSDEKRPSIFVDIANELIQKRGRKDLKFVIAGDGKERERIEKHIKSYQLENSFILLGAVEKQTIKELLSDSFAVLIVSYMEGISLVAGEALAMNVPVISTDVGAMTEIIDHGTNGYLVALGPNISFEMSDIVTQLLDSPLEYQRIVNETRSSVMKNFSLARMIDKYQETFEHVLKTPCVSLKHEGDV